MRTDEDRRDQSVEIVIGAFVGFATFGALIAVELILIHQMKLSPTLDVTCVRLAYLLAGLGGYICAARTLRRLRKSS